MRRPLTALTLLSLALAGCGDDEGNGNAYIRASIDGVLWSAEATEGQVAYYVDPPGDGIWTLAFREVGAGSQAFALVLPLPPDLGTHPLDGVTAQASYSNCPDDVLADCIYWWAVAEEAGTLTIDRVEPNSGLIEGSFTFVGRALGDPEGTVKVFTSGRFRIYAPDVFILD